MDTSPIHFSSSVRVKGKYYSLITGRVIDKVSCEDSESARMGSVVAYTLAPVLQLLDKFAGCTELYTARTHEMGLWLGQF
jgi:hypothetical protein